MSEEFKKVDPKEVEKEMIKRAEEHGNNVEEMALNAYRTLHPRFISGLRYLPSKGRLRLLKALVDYPINPGRYKLTDLEKELLEIGGMLLESKFILIMNTYAEHAEVLLEASESEEINLTDEEKAELLKEKED